MSRKKTTRGEERLCAQCAKRYWRALLGFPFCSDECMVKWEMEMAEWEAKNTKDKK